MTAKMRLARRVGAAAAVAVMASLALTASASAVLDPKLGKWSVAAPYTVSGELTLTKGGQTTTCQVSATVTNPAALNNAYDACGNGGSFNAAATMYAVWNNGSPQITWQQAYAVQAWHPFGGGTGGESWFYLAQRPSVANGNASTPTKIVFNNVIGSGRYDLVPISAVGELTITTTGGGLVTVQPYS